MVCWLGGSNKWNHLGRLEQAIYNNSAWAPLRIRGVKVECSYDVVRVRPGENVDFQRAVRAVHVTVPHQHRGKALVALRSMWAPGKKRHFPLNRKYTVVPNGGDPSMMVGNAARKD